MTTAILGVVALLAYLLGCIPAGYYLVRARTGRDLREIGSGSTGATNAARVLGRRGFAIVFALDFLKGIAAVALAALIGPDRALMQIAAVAVVVGHVFPAPLRFRGGKGVSPAFGALVVLAPLPTVAAAAIAGILVAAARTMRAGLVAFALLPFAIWYTSRSTGDTLAAVGVAAVVFLAHWYVTKPAVPAWDQQPQVHQ